MSKRKRIQLQELAEEVRGLRNRLENMERHLCIGAEGQYRVELKCDNCGEYNEVVIPRKYTVKGFLKYDSDINRVCWQCGIKVTVESN